MPLPVRLVAIGDSAFKAPQADDDTSDALVMRGYAIVLGHFNAATNTWQIQVLEFCGGKQSHVCRGVWSAELHNQCDMIDVAIILRGFFHEVRNGTQTSLALRDMLEYGNFDMPLDAFTDSYSIFSYLRSQHLKMPADKSTFYHLAHLREVLDRHLVNRYVWVDTRDMAMDIMTKGLSDRTASQQFMKGTWQMRHACEIHAVNELGS